MDEASGSALDATAGGKNLANFGNPITSSAGKINTARAFPGSGGASFFASSPSNFSPGSNSFSFSFWVNFSPTAGGDYEGLLAKGVVGPTNVEWLVYRHGDNRLRFSVSSNGSTLTTVTWPSTLSTGTWYFVAGEWDGTNINLSVNGATFQSTSFSGTIHSNTNNFDMGLISGSGNPLDGSVDEVGIWMGRALTQTEVSQLYNGGAGLPYDSFGATGTPTPTPTPPPPTPTPTATPTATPTPTPTSPFAADDFNRADGALGLNWAKPLLASEQTLVIVNNEVTPDIEGAHCYAYWIGNMFSQDQYSQVRISNVGPWSGVLARAQPIIDRFYMAFVFGPNDYRIFLRKDGLYYTLSLGSTETWATGDIIRLEAAGLNPVQLTLLRNGNPVLTYTDTTENLVGGSPGIGIYSPPGDHLAIDDWAGGNLGPLGPLMLDTQAPRVPGNLVATALGVSQVKLSWTVSTDNVRVKKYEVQRQELGSTSFVHVRTTTRTSYTDTGLAAGSSYSYRVLVRDAKGSLKKYSGVASVTTASPTIVPPRSR
jgi:hypothetical protein